jgi:hypothetical protein
LGKTLCSDAEGVSADDRVRVFGLRLRVALVPIQTASTAAAPKWQRFRSNSKFFKTAFHWRHPMSHGSSHQASEWLPQPAY